MPTDFDRDFIAVDDDATGDGTADTTEPVDGALVRAIDKNRALADRMHHSSTDYEDRARTGSPRPVLASPRGFAPSRWYAVYIPGSPQTVRFTIVGSVEADTDSNGNVHDDDWLEVGIARTGESQVFTGGSSSEGRDLQGAVDQDQNIVTLEATKSGWVELYVQCQGNRVAATFSTDISGSDAWLPFPATGEESSAHTFQARLVSSGDELEDSEVYMDLHAVRERSGNNDLARLTAPVDILGELVAPRVNTLDGEWVVAPRIEVDAVDLEVQRAPDPGRTPTPHPRRVDTPTYAADAIAPETGAVLERQSSPEIIAHGSRAQTVPASDKNWSDYSDALDEPTLAATMIYSQNGGSDISYRQAIRPDPKAQALRVKLLMVASVNRDFATGTGYDDVSDLGAPVEVRLLDDTLTQQDSAGPRDGGRLVGPGRKNVGYRRISADDYAHVERARADAHGITRTSPGWDYREGQWTEVESTATATLELSDWQDAFSRQDLAYLDIVGPVASFSLSGFDDRYVLSVVGLTVLEVWS